MTARRKLDTQPRAGALGIVIGGALGAYAAGISLLLMLRRTVGERWWAVGLANSFLHLLLLPALALLPIGVLLGRWRFALGLAPAAWKLWTWYGGQFLPRPVRAAPGLEVAPRLEILTFNLGAQSERFEGILAIIGTAEADIVALQELSIPAAEQLAGDLRARYPHQAFHPVGESTAGMGVLSRFPICADDYWRNEALPRPLGHQRAEFDLSALRSGARLVMYNSHPIHPGMMGRIYDDSGRALEIADLLARAEKETAPVVMLGDFNMVEFSDDYRRIRARYGDAFRAAGRGPGLTFPARQDADGVPPWLSWAVPRFPLLRLDYLFYSDGLHPLTARVGHTSGGSDHRPLLVRLALR